MNSLQIRSKLLLVIGIAVAVGLIALGVFYSSHQERAAVAQHEKTMHKLTESVIQGLQSVMLAGSAEIAQAFADRLKTLPEISDFRIMRVNGDEAFRDNSTIAEVNQRRGNQHFAPRSKESRIQVLSAGDPNLTRVITERKAFSVEETDGSGNRLLAFYAPIDNLVACHKCHGSANPVRGVIRLTTSLVPTERDILRVRQQSFVVIAIALAAIMLLTGFMLGRTIIAPVAEITTAMARVSRGDLDCRLRGEGGDEPGRMRAVFNQMAAALKIADQSRRDEQSALMAEIDRLSPVDKLTGLFNQHFLEQNLNVEFHRAVRTHEPLSILRLEISSFREFNDTYGFAQGDRVLQAVAATLRGALRKYDLPCRSADDQFVAILPNTAPEGVRFFAERVRDKIGEILVDGLTVTVKLGVASFPETFVESPEGLLEEAAQALARTAGGGA